MGSEPIKRYVPLYAAYVPLYAAAIWTNERLKRLPPVPGQLDRRVGRNRAHKPEAPAKGVRTCISLNALRLRFRLAASDFPGIACILDGVDLALEN